MHKNGFLLGSGRNVGDGLNNQKKSNSFSG